MKDTIDYVTVYRQHELDRDISIVKMRLREAKTFEATLAYRNLLTKLEHERRIIKKVRIVSSQEVN